MNDSSTFAVPGYITAIAGAFWRAGLPLYVVGGATRDFLLGMDIAEYDLCGPALPDEAARLMLDNGFTYKERARTYGTIVLCAHGQGAEYTTLRDDVYTRGHRPDFVRFTTDLGADALRRDFTMNAVYYDLHAGRFIDPLGGMEDIKKRVLRAAAPDPHKTIGEDGLRILRMLRFACTRRMRIDDALMAAARQHVALLDDISPERKWAELAVIFTAEWEPLGAACPQTPRQRDIVPLESPITPAGAGGYGNNCPLPVSGCEASAKGSGGQRPPASSPLDAMRALGVLDALFGAHTDVGLAKRAPVSLTTRLAALLHGGDAAAALNALRAPARLVRRTAHTARLLKFALEGGAPDIAQCVGMDERQVYEACATLGGDWQAYIERFGGRLPPLTLKGLDIDGRAVMELTGAKGERVGALLARLHRHTLQYPQDNNAARLSALCRLFAAEGDA